LLIGAQAYGLRGVTNDVTAMTAALDGRGFEIRRCEGPAAARDGILEAYERLIADTATGDVALVYYSGHGGYVRPEPGDERVVARINRQFIVPIDYRMPTGDDFRGITAVELSVLLGRLTQKTSNAVVVLDCCHAALMSRDGELTARALVEPTYVDLQAHLARQRTAGLRVDLSNPLGNPDAVRIVACASEQSAYEYPAKPDEWRGVFTTSLIHALTEAGDLPVSWSTLIRRIRWLVQAQFPNQRPEAEGPSRCMLFGATGERLDGWLPVRKAGPDQARIDGGPLLGVQAGDEFLIMAADAPDPDPAVAIAAVRVTRCTATAALGVLDLRPPHTALPFGARAYRVKAAATRIPVRLPDSHPQTTDLAAAMRRSTFVRPATPEDLSPLEVAVSANGTLTVHDRIGALHQPRPAGADGVRAVARDLERIARATALRAVREQSDPALAAAITLEWGRVRDGRAEPLDLSGAAVLVGGSVYVKVRNIGGETVYLSLIDAGVSYGITVLTAFAPSGIRLLPGDQYVYGEDDDGRLVGVGPTWPEGLDPAYPRPETVLALVTKQPEDVMILEQDRAGRAVRSVPSPLEELLEQIRVGTTRDLGRAKSCADGYAVRTVEFTLVATE
jgi:uncharacterized caspase-like protein